MSQLSSIRLNDPLMSPEGLANQREKTVLFLSTFDQIHIAKPNSGTGAKRTVILTRYGTQWVQVVKIWGKTKSETYAYAVKLVFDARRLQQEVKVQTRNITEARYEQKQKLKAAQVAARNKAIPTTYNPKHQVN